MQDYAMPYKDLGIKIDSAIKKANIAGYTVDIGSNTIRLKIYEYKNNKIKSVFSKIEKTERVSLSFIRPVR